MSSLLRMVGLFLSSGWQPARTYECEFEIPFEVTVAPNDETPGLTSSTPLDKAMASAFRVRSSDRRFFYHTGSGPNPYETLMTVFYEDLPMAVAFRVQFHLTEEPQASPVREHARQIRAQAGMSGEVVLRPTDFGIRKHGTHAGTLILRPDPNVAFADPAIETIWNGTLELPISFTLSNQPNSP